GFDGGGAAGREPVLVAAGGGGQAAGRSFAGEAGGGADGGAGSGDFGVGGALNAAFEFAGAVTGEHRMGVGVDEAGEHDAAAGIDDFSAGGEGWLDLGAGAHGYDAAVPSVQRAIVDDGERAHGGSRARTGRPGEGDELPAVEDGEVSHRGIRGCPLGRLVHPSEARTKAEGEGRGALGWTSRRLIPQEWVGLQIIAELAGARTRRS